jgi:hypothetical protein
MDMLPLLNNSLIKKEPPDPGFWKTDLDLTRKKDRFSIDILCYPVRSNLIGYLIYFRWLLNMASVLDRTTIL